MNSDRNILKNLKPLFRYLLVGGMATICNYLIFIFLIMVVKAHYLLAASTGYIVSVLGGYFFNKRWTFNNASSYKETFLKYFMVYLTTLILSTLILKGVVEWFLLPPELGNLLAIAFAVCSNYMGLKYLVFRTSN